MKTEKLFTKQRAALALATVMMVSIIAGVFAANSSPTFSDVPTNHWAYSYVERAADNGWVNGIGNGKFGVDNNVTYGDAVNDSLFALSYERAGGGSAFVNGDGQSVVTVQSGAFGYTYQSGADGTPADSKVSVTINVASLVADNYAFTDSGEMLVLAACWDQSVYVISPSQVTDLEVNVRRQRAPLPFLDLHLRPNRPHGAIAESALHRVFYERGLDYRAQHFLR